jgi:hypothetical protein
MIEGMDERIRRRLITELSPLPRSDFSDIFSEVEGRADAEEAGAAFLGALLERKRPLAGLLADDTDEEG